MMWVYRSDSPRGGSLSAQTAVLVEGVKVVLGAGPCLRGGGLGSRVVDVGCRTRRGGRRHAPDRVRRGDLGPCRLRLPGLLLLCEELLPLRLDGRERPVVEGGARVLWRRGGIRAGCRAGVRARGLGDEGVCRRRLAHRLGALRRAALGVLGDLAHVIHVAPVLRLLLLALARALLALRLEASALAQLRLAPGPGHDRQPVLGEDWAVVHVRQGAAAGDELAAVLVHALQEGVALELHHGELRQSLEHVDDALVVHLVVLQVEHRE
mmetsp:Transcript_16349/g.47665  ORF Transcript_16349/g.47665 Transcript_16349/m.47665 type:complete len:266 (+) Transcript_16349:110-907(+)